MGGILAISGPEAERRYGRANAPLEANSPGRAQSTRPTRWTGCKRQKSQSRGSTSAAWPWRANRSATASWAKRRPSCIPWRNGVLPLATL